MISALCAYALGWLVIRGCGCERTREDEERLSTCQPESSVLVTRVPQDRLDSRDLHRPHLMFSQRFGQCWRGWANWVDLMPRTYMVVGI